MARSPQPSPRPRGAEIHLDAAVWTVPGARMKAKRDHRVPLSGRAVEVLRAARRLGDGTGLVLPSSTVAAIGRHFGVDHHTVQKAMCWFRQRLS